MMSSRKRKKGFSLIELVIVVVIIGIIAVIAIPRMTRGASNSGASALRGDLAVLRNAIELYRAEHEGAFPTLASFVSQMTSFSNFAGSSFSSIADQAGGIIYGPYLKALPPLPIGAKKGATGVDSTDTVGTGWIYTEVSGDIKCNTTTETDPDGTAYNTY